MIAIYLDTETTGLDTRRSHVVEIAAVAVDGDLVLDTFQSLANPGEEALAHPSVHGALKVNGLTRMEILDADPVDTVATRLRVWLGKFEECTLHAYNNAFDASFLAREPWALNPMAWGECVMRAVAGGRRFMKLSVVAQHFDLDWDGDAHRALADAKMAHRVHRAWQKRQGLVRV